MNRLSTSPTAANTIAQWIEFYENEIKRADYLKRESEIFLPRLRELRVELETP